VIGVETLQEAIDFTTGKVHIDPLQTDTREIFQNSRYDYEADFADVQGQENIKRALEIAAAGGHNVIMIGPPGAGKTDAGQAVALHSAAAYAARSARNDQNSSGGGKLGQATALYLKRPYRSPASHHQRRSTGGWRGIPQPGEISLAHNGILFLTNCPSSSGRPWK
jgi:magnesium chelatase family protein